MFDPNRIPTISATEANQRLGTPGETPPLLVDVREPNEIVQARAEGIVMMPLSTFMLRHQELPKDQPLLMICRSGSRSAQATAFLLSNGWSDVQNVAGGMLSWEQSGLSIRRGPLAPGEGDLPG